MSEGIYRAERKAPHVLNLSNRYSWPLSLTSCYFIPSEWASV